MLFERMTMYNLHYAEYNLFILFPVVQAHSVKLAGVNFKTISFPPVQDLIKVSRLRVDKFVWTE
jgi:hypothetical protein